MKLFKRKKNKYDVDLDNLPPAEPRQAKSLQESQALPQAGTQAPMPASTSAISNIEADNIKLKLDLILTELSNIKMQNQNITEKLKALEESSKSDQKPIRYY